MVQLIVTILLVIIFSCLVRAAIALTIALFKWDQRNWKALNPVKVVLLAVYEALKFITWIPYHMFHKVEKAIIDFVQGGGETPDRMTMGVTFGAVMLTFVTWFHLNPLALTIGAFTGCSLIFIAFRLGISRAVAVEGGENTPDFSVDFRPVLGVSVLILALLLITLVY